MVTAVVVTAIGQGLAQPDPASVVRIELSEYAFNPAQVRERRQSGHAEGGQHGRRDPHVCVEVSGSQDLEIEGADMEVDAPNGVKYVKLQPVRAPNQSHQQTAHSTSRATSRREAAPIAIAHEGPTYCELTQPDHTRRSRMRRSPSLLSPARLCSDSYCAPCWCPGRGCLEWSVRSWPKVGSR